MKFLDLPKYGPVHRFADYHVYRTLLLLSDGRRRGRKSLAEAVDVGEGSMRTILEFLRDKGYIDVKQTGIKISHKGQEFLRKIPIHMERLEPSDISISERNVAVLVRSRAERIALGIEQRDAAIKAGAEGATTIVMKAGRMLVPPDYSLDKEKPDIAKGLRKLLSPAEGDVVIIGSAGEYGLAEDGALAAAFALL
jgi:DNA-binding PadR family transcriptional regulator